MRKEKKIVGLIKTDYLFIGDSVTILPIAEKLSSEGKKILIACSRTYMGYEVCRYFRPWYESSAGKATADKWFPGAYCEYFSSNGETPVHLDRFKTGFEDSLLSMGAEIVYNLQLVYTKREEDKWNSSFGAKGGLLTVISDYLIDFTENNITAALLPSNRLKHILPPELEDDIIRRTVEFINVKEDFPVEIVLPREFSEIAQNKINVHRGAYSNQHVYVEIPILAEGSRDRSCENDMRTEWLARKTSFEVCQYLVNHEEAFAGAQICLSSPMAMRRKPMDPFELLEKAALYASGDIDLKRSECLCIANKQSCYSNFGIAQEEYPPLGDVDVCVVGGGPSGSSAAFAAGREGASVMLIEFNDELGGTGTSGQVRWYWFGMRRGFTKTYDDCTDKWQKLLGWNKQNYIWGMDDEWSSEAKATAYFELCASVNAEVFFECLAFDVISEENEVKGVLVATPYGGRSVRCKVAVDATGDGDIAAYAGAEYQYGNARDRMTMWAALAPMASPATYDGDYTSTADVEDPVDCTRFIITNRRRNGMAGGSFINTKVDKTAVIIGSGAERAGLPAFDHAVYLAPRESRHILGGYTMTLTDQLLQKRYKDTIMVAYSNNDPKGISMADIMNIGFLPPNLHIHVPYRCIVPKNIEGLIIAGRALSCTHDANCAVRMQDDMQMLGGAAGIAAAIAISTGVAPRDIDVRNLQYRLMELDAIDISSIRHGDDLCDFDIVEAVMKIKNGNGLKFEVQNALEYSSESSPVTIICNADRAKAIPVLIKALKELPETPARLLISRLLLYHGCDEGLGDVLNRIENDLSQGVLKPREDVSGWGHIPPDHNMMPETAYLLHNLAFCGSKRVLPVFEKLADIICSQNLDYFSNSEGVFYYIRSVAYAAERLVFSEFIPLLTEILGLREISCLKDKSIIEPSVLNERFAYLALMINMALARCGSKDGYIGLKECMKDARSLIRKSAHDELCLLLACDMGRDSAKWDEAVSRLPKNMQPIPWTEKIE